MNTNQNQHDARGNAASRHILPEHSEVPSLHSGGGGGAQLILATLLVIFGVVLITAAFIVPPPGVIDPTVLTAFGEILTFAGSLIGIDYHYRYRPPTGGNE